MKKKVLIVSASAGAGHTISALAVKEGITKLFPEEIEITHIDILDYTTYLMRKVYKDLYLYLAKKRPLIYGMVYKSTERKEYKSGSIDWVHTRKFRKYLKKNKFDFIISTHFLSSNVIARMKAKNKIDTPLMNILTDFGAHPIWLAKADFSIVPDQYNVQFYNEMNISQGNVYDYGIPIKPIFTENKNRDEIRKNIGLASSKTTILLLSGGFGVGPIEKIIYNLEKVKSPIEVIVICGKNEKLLKDCNEIKNELKYKIIPVGYTTQMDEYMKASDIVITKPGGLTIAESLACNLPIVIVNPIIGQEDKNADKLLEEGCAIKMTYLPVIYYKIDKLLNDKAKLKSMKNKVKELAKPQAAFDIAKLVHKNLFNSF